MAAAAQFIWKELGIMSKCTAKTEIYSRVVGYFRPVSNWNRGKREEFNDRKTFAVPSSAALTAKKSAVA